MRKSAFANHDFKRGEVVVNYIRKLIFLSEAAKREAEYATQGKAIVVIHHRGQSLV